MIQLMHTKYNDGFIYNYLETKVKDMIDKNDIVMTSKHNLNTKQLQYIVPEHPSDPIDIEINQSKINIQLPLLKSPYSFKTNFIVTKEKPYILLDVLKFLDNHFNYYRECYL